MHEQAERDYMLGMKYKDIAIKHGVTINTVKSWKKRHGWKREPAHKKVHTKAEDKRVQNTPAVIPVVDDGLTEKQRLFCLYYIKNFNATTSALRAGYTEKYPGETGYQLLQKNTVRAEVDRLKKLKQQSIMLNEDDIVERYMRIAFADMTDFAMFGTESYPAVDDAGSIMIGHDGKVIYQKRSYLDFKDHDQVDGGLICEISVGRQGMKVKLEDRQKALSWLSDYFNMNPMNQHKVQYNNAMLAIKQKELDLKDW